MSFCANRLRKRTGTGEFGMRADRCNADKEWLITFGNSIEESQSFLFYEVSVILPRSWCWRRLVFLECCVPVDVSARVDKDYTFSELTKTTISTETYNQSHSSRRAVACSKL